jgi:hypothetical protein
MNVQVNKIPASGTCFEKELYIGGYTYLQFLFNTVILKSAQNVPLQRVWDFIAQKCKLLCSDAVLLSPLLLMTSFGYLSVFMAL